MYGQHTDAFVCDGHAQLLSLAAIAAARVAELVEAGGDLPAEPACDLDQLADALSRLRFDNLGDQLVAY